MMLLIILMMIPCDLETLYFLSKTVSCLLEHIEENELLPMVAVARRE